MPASDYDSGGHLRAGEERAHPAGSRGSRGIIQILEYLVKNANKNLHQAANKGSFQKSLLGLLRRLRGRSSFIKDLRSNAENWNKIEAKVLYLIQLWYDAFILEESVYDNIITAYKTLHQENVIFPPRSPNEKNLLFVKTESPILDNIEDIARTPFPT